MMKLTQSQLLKLITIQEFATKLAGLMASIKIQISTTFHFSQYKTKRM
jgi:hypothetical protein